MYAIRRVLPELERGRVIIIISGSSSQHLQKLRKNILMSFMNIFQSARNCSMNERVIFINEYKKIGGRVRKWSRPVFFVFLV